MNDHFQLWKLNYPSQYEFTNKIFFEKLGLTLDEIVYYKENSNNIKSLK